MLSWKARGVMLSRPRDRRYSTRSLTDPLLNHLPLPTTMILNPTAPKHTPEPLCLACASSLPPRGPPPHTTACCARPICARCLAARPRLATYTPCLVCLSGVGASTAASAKDDTHFEIGDADEDVEDGPPPYISPADTPTASTESSVSASRPASPIPPVATSPANTSGAQTYHLKPADTLSGLALRFRLSPRALCAANGLPPSTATTQPHLLHTRTSLVIPLPDGSVPTGLTSVLFSADDEDPEREAKRARERAAVRLATLTKEADPRVVRAYVALAEDDVHAHAHKAKERGVPAGGLEGAAVDAYLDDAEWERAARARGERPRGQASQSRGWGVKVW
jgi:hypothetical protein